VGAERHARNDMLEGDEEAAESRTVQLAGGMRWRATVVARMISEEGAAGQESARLVLRLECLSARRRPIRAAIAGARSLADVSDQVFEGLIARPSARPRTATKSGR